MPEGRANKAAAPCIRVGSFKLLFLVRAIVGIVGRNGGKEAQVSLKSSCDKRSLCVGKMADSYHVAGVCINCPLC